MLVSRAGHWAEHETISVLHEPNPRELFRSDLRTPDPDGGMGVLDMARCLHCTQTNTVTRKRIHRDTAL